MMLREADLSLNVCVSLWGGGSTLLLFIRWGKEKKERDSVDEMFAESSMQSD